MSSEARLENLALYQNEISIYRGELTQIHTLRQIIRAKMSFPNLPDQFFDVLRERIEANKFTDPRLADAVSHVIDNCHYPTPTVADFISFDKKVKLNSYEDMLKKTNELGKEVWDSYEQQMLPGRKKPVWIHVDEVKLLGL
jgi:hypothetical protein